MLFTRALVETSLAGASLALSICQYLLDQSIHEQAETPGSEKKSKNNLSETMCVEREKAPL